MTDSAKTERHYPSGSKARIETVSSELLARRGYNGMGLKAVSEAAGLPYGSIYHHFPGGKEEIAASAIGSVGTVVGGLLETLFASRPPDKAVRAMFDHMSGRLAASEWADGCPVGTPAQDGAADSEAVRHACDVALEVMVTAVSAALVDAGLKRKLAGELGTTIVAAYEGATMLARVQRSAVPLQAAGNTMARLVKASLA